MQKISRKVEGNKGAHEVGAKHYAAVSEAAYYLAEKRGFEPGSEMEDWLAAETLILDPQRIWGHAGAYQAVAPRL
jgi:hypothetical protein